MKLAAQFPSPAIATLIRFDASSDVIVSPPNVGRTHHDFCFSSSLKKGDNILCPSACYTDSRSGKHTSNSASAVIGEYGCKFLNSNGSVSLYVKTRAQWSTHWRRRSKCARPEHLHQHPRHPLNPLRPFHLHQRRYQGSAGGSTVTMTWSC